MGYTALNEKSETINATALSRVRDLLESLPEQVVVIRLSLIFYISKR
jgi:hypothetical protein